jgi:hypothetical protein
LEPLLDRLEVPPVSLRSMSPLVGEPLVAVPFDDVPVDEVPLVDDALLLVPLLIDELVVVSLLIDAPLLLPLFRSVELQAASASASTLLSSKVW